MNRPMEFSQEHDSVLSHVFATPSDLTTVGQTAELIAMNRQVNQILYKDDSTTFNDYTPLLMTGPSGVGKGTMIDHLTNTYKGKFGFSVSYTTRAPREGETDGVQYNFVSKDEFQEMIDGDQFIEWAHVHNNMYGTAKS